MQLEKLILQIQSLDGTLKHEANKAVNRLLTMRNWLIGYYIVEYEQKGEDRAKYGDTLLNVLSASLDIKGLSLTNLKLNRLFYIAYPQIHQTVSDELQNNTIQIGQTLSDQLQIFDNQSNSSLLSTPNELENTPTQIVQTLSAQFELAKKIIDKLSFSHITLLLPIDNELKRAFYAIEAIKGTWSVRELKRQIDSLLFERSGMSKKPEQLLSQLDTKAEKFMIVV